MVHMRRELLADRTSAEQRNPISCWVADTPIPAAFITFCTRPHAESASEHGDFLFLQMCVFWVRMGSRRRSISKNEQGRGDGDGIAGGKMERRRGWVANGGLRWPQMSPGPQSSGR